MRNNKYPLRLKTSVDIRVNNIPKFIGKLDCYSWLDNEKITGKVYTYSIVYTTHTRF
ncbi:MAG: hypothetical protein ACXAC7_12540 [Candidatus Hodarchaeales archaeon]